MTALDDLVDRIRKDEDDLKALDIVVLGFGEGAQPSLEVATKDAEAATRELRARYGPGIDINVVASAADQRVEPDPDR
jgi:hypothetical protein